MITPSRQRHWYRSRSTPAIARLFLAAFVVFEFVALTQGQDGTTNPRTVRFQQHVIDLACENSACAALDVNQDGSLDIVAGDYWYSAPDWNRTRVREVERIRGRWDDYANLPMDVNGDGRTDIVSVNYRSRSLYWVEQPRVPTEPWTKHAIDTPGASETGRLYDIDRNGQVDVLPNGTEYAAWYELVRDSSDSDRGPTWIRHDLPSEIAGHGIGFGDVDGDGRGDIVTPRGWFAGPENPRRGRWIQHAEFQLHPDCGIPILVYDVDGDGDNDLIWSRGHNIGIYWLEQQTTSASERRWSMHAIDTSWSCAHALELADIDGDQQLDLVAGKRYLGHDGRDPDEYSPLAIYWYAFDASSRSWWRQAISSEGRCGWDIDPKCVDLDGDGDVDLLAAARCGLHFIENLGPAADAATVDRVSALIETATDDPYAQHVDLSYYLEGSERRPINTPADWGLRRQHVLEGMQRAMGPIPDPHRRVPLDVRVEQVEDAGTYLRQKISYCAEPGDRVPSYLLIPKALLEGESGTRRAPAMLCLHPTHPIGKAQLCGLGGRPSQHYAHELAERGFVCLVPDYPSFGDYTYDFAAHADHYASGTMKGIWNHIRGVDVLESMPQVDPNRIGCIGHSLGGHNSLFVAAFDQRLRAIVTSCGFNGFEHYFEGDLTGWTSDRYMPRIRDIYRKDPQQVPFDFHEVLAAMAPRPVFINAPLHDDNFAVEGVRQAVDAARTIYQLYGHSERLQVIYPDADHDFPDPVRMQVYAWLSNNL